MTMTMYDDPNREAVGLEPAWVEGTGGEPPGAANLPGGEPEADVEAFDPGGHTVAEVQDYLAAHPDQTDAVLDAEAAGKNRATLTGG